MPYPIKTLSELPLLLHGLRKSQKLTQADMARQLGISQQSYAKLEANPSVASMARLFRVLQLLNAQFVIETASLSSRPDNAQYFSTTPALPRTTHNIAAQEVAPYVTTRIRPEDTPSSPKQTMPNKVARETVRENQKSNPLADQLAQDAIAHFKKDPW